MFSEPCAFVRRLQHIESDTGYDTPPRAYWNGALAGVSQTAVCDTGGSAPPASQRRMAPVGSYSLMRVLFPPWTDGSGMRTTASAAGTKPFL